MFVSIVKVWCLENWIMFIDFFMNCMIEQKSCEKTETFTQIDTIIYEKSDEHKLIFNT